MSKHRHISSFILAIGILSILISPISATNQQRTFGVHTAEWQQTSELCRLAGVVGPSSAGPVTARELNIALNRIDLQTLSSEAQTIFHKVQAAIDNPRSLYSSSDFSFALAPTLAFESYLQSHGEEVTQRDWILPYRDRKPFLDIDMKMSVGSNFYGFFSYMLKAQNDDKLAAKQLSHNLSGGFIQIQTMQPFSTGIVAGGNDWNLSLARDRLSIGNGYTGNLFVGDNFSYQEYLKFTLCTNPFTYSFIMTHFDQQTDKTLLESFRFGGPHQQRISHRFSINFANRVSFSVTDNTLFQTESGFDIRMLNPFMFLHNYNNFRQSAELAPGDEANNFTGFELEVPFYPGWSFTAQGVLDQVQTSDEKNNDDGSIFPNAWGALANVTGTWAIDKGILSTYIEGVYTSPYLYLNKKGTTAEGEIWKPDWNYDLIVGYDIAGGPELSYTGYIHGPDSVVGAIGISYAVPQKWSVATQILYKAHGRQGIDWRGDDSQKQELQPGVDHMNDISPTGIVEHTLQTTINGKIQLGPGIFFDGTCGIIKRWNNHNVKGDDWFDLQLAVGCSINPLVIFP